MQFLIDIKLNVLHKYRQLIVSSLRIPGDCTFALQETITYSSLERSLVTEWKNNFGVK
jgi:hypothetical protein